MCQSYKQILNGTFFDLQCIFVIYSISEAVPMAINTNIIITAMDICHLSAAILNMLIYFVISHTVNVDEL